MATEVVVPPLGESVKQAILIRWHKNDGEAVARDEMICELETDKANVDIPAPVAGVIRTVKSAGDTVAVGEVVARIDEGGTPTKTSAPDSAAKTKPAETPVEKPAEAKVARTQEATPQAAAKTTTAAPGDYSPAVRRLLEEHLLDPAAIPATGPGGRLTKEDVEKFVAERKAAESAQAPKTETPPPAKPAAGRPTEKAPPSAPPPKPIMDFDAQGIHRTPISKIRKRIAENLVRAQQTAAILTTFNEVDMQAISDLRTKYKERFQEIHGIGLGFMSFFVRAAALALKEFPRVNAFLEGDDIVYHNYVHMGIAVSTERGLAVPVLRNADSMSFARIEAEIKRLATATRDGKLGLDELSGGTFTITNGGVFGSLLSTPILNPPQSGILGMHAIQKRPVVVNDKIEIRPMMYIALSYDHRLVDGRESVSFLVRLKQYLEDPARLMLEI